MNRHSLFLQIHRMSLIVVVASWHMPVFADDSVFVPRHEAARSSQVRKMQDSTGKLTLDDVVNRVRMQTDGRILSAEESGAEYRIRVLTGNGKVRRLRIDPATGEVIR